MIAELPFLSGICKKFHTAYDMFTVSNFKLGMHRVVENVVFPIHFIMRPPCGPAATTVAGEILKLESGSSLTTSFSDLTPSANTVNYTT